MTNDHLLDCLVAGALQCALLIDSNADVDTIAEPEFGKIVEEPRRIKNLFEEPAARSDQGEGYCIWFGKSFDNSRYLLGDAGGHGHIKESRAEIFSLSKEEASRC